MSKKHQPATAAPTEALVPEVMAGPDSPDADLELAAARTLAPLTTLIESIPSAEEDPTPRMMQAIFEAGSPEDWEKLFTAQHFKDHAGDKIRVHTFRPLRSSYPGHLGWYLLCEVTWLDTGEIDVLTVGSQMAMAQLLNCWKRNDFPHDFEIVAKDRATKRGFIPMRLRSLRSRAQIEG